MLHHIFLSYSRKDTSLMRQIRDSLRAEGLAVWTDEGIKPGVTIWEREIEDALTNAGCMVVILTPNIKDAKGLRDEISYANIHRVQIFPLLAKGEPRDSVPYTLSSTQWVDIRDDYPSGIAQIIRTVCGYLSIDSLSQLGERIAQEEAERQRLEEIEARAKYEAEEAARQRIEQERAQQQAEAEEAARLQAEAEETERKRVADLEAQTKYEAEERERQRIKQLRLQQQAEAEEATRLQAEAEEVERQHVADLEAQQKALADEEERERKARARAEAAEKTRQRRAELVSALRRFTSTRARITVFIILVVVALFVLLRVVQIGPNSPIFPAVLVTHNPNSTVTPNLTATIDAIMTSFVTETQLANLSATQNGFATATPHLSILHNADWKPVEKDFNGVTMVQVPAGCFDMGSQQGSDDEKPVTTICFDKSFWIDKMEVTNAQFIKFKGYAEQPSHWIDPDRPRETITWFEARDFCELRGGRLPTEAEWEYAARGPDNLIYPWGNAFNAANAVYSDNSNSQTAAVGSKPSGASWIGAQDMSGNVLEWVSTLYEPYHYPTPGSAEERDQWIARGNTTGTRSLRSGTWHHNSDSLRAAYRFGHSPDFKYDDLGFRCIVSAPIF